VLGGFVCLRNDPGCPVNGRLPEWVPLFHGEFTIKTRLAGSKLIAPHYRLQTFELSVFGLRKSMLVFFIVTCSAILCSLKGIRVFREFTVFKHYGETKIWK
jgi:hypothetical protein